MVHASREPLGRPSVGVMRMRVQELPVLVLAVLAVGGLRLSRSGIYIKRLRAAEALGCARRRVARVRAPPRRSAHAFRDARPACHKRGEAPWLYGVAS